MTTTIVQEGSSVPRQGHRSRWKWIAAMLVVTSAFGLHACGSDGGPARTERTSAPPAATTAPTTVTTDATMTLPATTRPSTPARSPTSPSVASRSAAITVQWSETGRLMIDGSGFQPNERVTVTLTIQSQQLSGGSSQTLSQQSTVSVSADAQGNLRVDTTIAASTGASLHVTAAGDRGSSAEMRIAVPSQ